MPQTAHNWTTCLGVAFPVSSAADRRARRSAAEMTRHGKPRSPMPSPSSRPGTRGSPLGGRCCSHPPGRLARDDPAHADVRAGTGSLKGEVVVEIFHLLPAALPTGGFAWRPRPPKWRKLLRQRHFMGWAGGLSSRRLTRVSIKSAESTQYDGLPGQARQ